MQYHTGDFFFAQVERAIMVCMFAADIIFLEKGSFLVPD